MWMQLAVVIVVLVLESSTAVLEHIYDHRSRTRNSMTSCLLKITDHHFHKGEIISFLSSSIDGNQFAITVSTDEMLLRDLFNKQKWSILTRKPTNVHSKFKFFKKSHNYIIHIRTKEEIITALPFLKDIAWNPHAKFLVVTTTIFDKPTEVVTYLSEKFWKQKALNIIYLLPQKRNPVQTEIYTWFPFSQKHCANNYSDMIEVIDVCRFGEFNKNVSVLFPEKVPSNLNGCPVNVGTVPWAPYIIKPKGFVQKQQSMVNFTKGLEIMLLNTVAEILNFTVVYSVSEKRLNWGSLNATGVATGLMHLLITEQIDLAMASLAATPTRYLMLDPSIPYTSESLTWCVPTASPKPIWTNIFHMYTFYVWMFTIVIYVFVSMCFYGFSYFQPVSIAFNSLPNSFFNALAILLSVSIWKKPSGIYSQTFFILWTTVSLHMAVLYQSSLINFLMYPLYQKQITTLEEVVDQQIAAGSFFIWKRYVSEASAKGTVEEYLCDHWIECPHVDRCLRNVAFNKNYSMLIPRMYVSYMSEQFRNQEGKRLLYWFKEDYISFPVQMFAYRGYPLLNRINHVISMIQHTGILDKWETDLAIEMQSIVADSDDDDDDGTRTLRIEHLQGAFMMYGFGLTFACLVFVIEWFLHLYCICS